MELSTFTNGAGPASESLQGTNPRDWIRMSEPRATERPLELGEIEGRGNARASSGRDGKDNGEPSPLPRRAGIDLE